MSIKDFDCFEDHFPSSFHFGLICTQMGDTDLTLAKYLVYDNQDYLDAMFDEEDWRESLA